MKNKKLIVVFFVLFFWSFVQEGSEIIKKINFVNKKGCDVAFSIVLDDGTEIKNICFDKFGKRETGILKFSSEKGFKVKNDNGFLLLDNYLIVLDKSIDIIKSKYKNLHSFNIYSDFNIVKGMWPYIVEEVKEAAKKMTGVCKPKSKKIYHVINRALRKSEKVIEECKIMRKHGYKCDPASTGTGSPAFKSEYYDKPWKNILDDPDAGLRYPDGYSVSDY